MSDNHPFSLITLIFTMLCAYILALLPIPGWAMWLMPQWVVLAVIYWVFMYPLRVNILFAATAGLLLDALQGSLLGEHALALTLVAFIVAKLHRRLRLFPFWQQILTVMFLVAIYQFVIYIIQGIIGQLPANPAFWLTAISSGFFWPWIYVVLRDWTHKKVRYST